MKDQDEIAQKLSESKIYQDYERAFTDATGLPVSLRPVESWQLAHSGKRGENPFCRLMAQKSGSCASCLQTQQCLAEAAREQAHSVNCVHGMCDTAVPVRLGERVLGFLQTGQVFRRPPTLKQFEHSAQLAKDWGVPASREELQKAYFQTKVLGTREHKSVVQLLSIFAQHLSLISNRIVVEQQNAEIPAVRKAKEYIQQHSSEKLSLSQVAKAVNSSTFYFCKLFKRVTGLNFTHYVSRVRIERAKNLLLNPNLRISEIAFEVGFESLTHFNRVFKKVIGQSPTTYRAQLKCV